MKNVVITLLLMSITVLGHAHGDLHKRIVSATESIASDPDNEKLYFHRGKLYYHHQDYENGISDLETAISKGYKGEQVHLFLSKCHYAIRAYDKAEDEVLKFFAKSPENVRAHNLYGQILYHKNQFSTSAAEFQYVIENATNPLPENYIDAAKSWNALDSEEGVDQAVLILQRGLTDHGPLISLQKHLVKILLAAQRYDQAIAVQESIIETKQRKETAYFTLFEMASANGDLCLARDALTKAEISWNTLPARIKKNSAMIQLRKNIDISKYSLTSRNCE